jgi:short-subunit dehydrogenase
MKTSFSPSSPPTAGSIVLFGATSGIAREVTRELLRRGREVVLVGRDADRLRAEAADLEVRLGRACPVYVWDLLDREHHERRFRELVAAHEIAGVFFAAGVLFPEKVAEGDADVTRLLFDMNLTETVVVLNLFADQFRKRGAGFLSVLSSVAGDRGRAANKTYGAGKAGLSAYLEGLRASLHGSGVLVQTVKPGPVRTPMLAAYKGPKILLADPAKVARDIVRGIERRQTTVYTPGYWWWVMAVIRALPEFLARKVPG